MNQKPIFQKQEDMNRMKKRMNSRKQKTAIQKPDYYLFLNQNLGQKNKKTKQILRLDHRGKENSSEILKGIGYYPSRKRKTKKSKLK